MSGSMTNERLEFTRTRTWLFIFILTVIIPILLLLMLEAGLRIIGYGYPTSFFIRRNIEGQTVYTDNLKFSQQFFPPPLARPSCHMVIPADKPEGTFRIFMLGGSAAMGDPDFSYGVSRMLETILNDEYPNKKIEIYNVAITAINSNVVLPIARDCARLQPDLYIVYLGNNEVIGPYGPGTVFAPFLSNRAFIRTSIFLNSTKIGQLIANVRYKLSSNEKNKQIWTGIEMFTENRIRFDDPRMESVYDHFKANLKDICQTAQKAGARIIVSTVASNLLDCPPFAALHRNEIGDDSIDEWYASYQAGIESETSGMYEQAIERYQDALTIDDEFADIHFRLARCYYELDRFDEARDHFTKARNLDALRFRADTHINSIIKEITANDTNNSIFLVDAEQALLAESVHGIPGDKIFYDHVHLNFHANYQLACLLSEKVNTIIDGDVQGQQPSEAVCMDRLAFTLWDRYRIESEILGRMKSPAFAQQLDNEKAVQHWASKLVSLQRSMTPEALKKELHRYQLAIEKNQKDWVLQNNFGLLLLEAGNDPANAAEQFRSVLRLFPDDYLTLNNLGVAYTQQRKFDQAVKCFDDALKIKPNFTKADFNLGDVFERQGSFDRAIECYQRAGLPPHNLAEAHNRFGIKYASSEKNELAIKQFEAAIDLWPDYAEVHLNLGRLFSQRGKAEMALQHFSEAVRIKPDMLEAQIALASLLFMEKDYTNAAEHYQTALKIQPELPEVQNNLGLALCNNGKFEQAIPHFRQALVYKKSYSAARNNLAGALSQLGRSEEAIAQLKQLLKINPDDASCYNNLGTELLKLGKTEEAIRQFRKALKINPNLPSARNNLNYALSKIQKSESD
ncbi:tetratricopeptide repeat protein [candidate division KSB1 bacterium]|nr:tetratricopeptide repeat protein [candidate division KSB1 bacterium]